MLALSCSRPRQTTFYIRWHNISGCTQRFCAGEGSVEAMGPRRALDGDDIIWRLSPPNPPLPIPPPPPRACLLLMMTLGSGVIWRRQHVREWLFFDVWLFATPVCLTLSKLQWRITRSRRHYFRYHGACVSCSSRQLAPPHPVPSIPFFSGRRREMVIYSLELDSFWSGRFCAFVSSSVAFIKMSAIVLRENSLD